MPRSKGHDGREVHLLALLEDARMNLGRRSFEAREIALRLKQGRERTRGQLDDLLAPGEERLMELMNGLEQYARHIDEAIRTLQTH